jgi:hypothetical protein
LCTFGALDSQKLEKVNNYKNLLIILNSFV